MFLSYMAGQYNDKAKEKFEATKGKCIQYVELAKGNHYAITDWNPDTAPYQVGESLPSMSAPLIRAVMGKEP